MNYIWNILKNMNSKYDKIEEPTRFFTFLIATTLIILVTTINPYIGVPIILLLIGIRICYHLNGD